MTSPISEDTSTKSPDATPAEPAAPRGFLPATVDELKLVVWPSRQQLFSESIAVILMVSLSAAGIAAVSGTPVAAMRFGKAIAEAGADLFFVQATVVSTEHIGPEG